jgi:hypothetical protein
MAYDSSSITPNADGSVMERQKYLQSMIVVEETADESYMKVLSDMEQSYMKVEADSIISYMLINSIDEIEYIEEHFHNKERWYGKITGNNETNAIENNLTPFRVTSGVGGYGTAVCVIGSGDVPVTGKTHFDLHRLLCSSFQKAELAKIRLAWGATTEADAITAGNYSTVMVNPLATSKETDFEIRFPVVSNGTKVWVNFWSTTNSQWVDLFIGLHGY